MLFNLSEYAPEPLHDQLRNQIIEMILAGGLKPDDRLLPIPVMASEQKVSARTVRRSYRDLEKMGFLREGPQDHFTINEMASSGRLLTADNYTGINRTLSALGTVRPCETFHDELIEELERAKRIQRALLPGDLPDNRKITVRAFCSSEKSVGGDLVDAFYLDDKHLGLLIADACGSGLSAALLIARVHAVIRSESRHSGRPTVIINQLCRQVEETLPRDKFITLFFAVYETERHRLTYVNCGHPSPLLYSKSASYPTLSHRNPALGVVRGHCYKGFVKTLSNGDCLLLYTDGISEAMNRCKEEYGEKRIEAILQRYHHDPKRLIDTLIGELNLFTATQEAEDDRSVLVLKINNSEF